MLKKINSHSLTFWMINFYILILIFIPKSLNTIFSFPINMAVMGLLLIIFVYEKYSKKITLNNHNIKSFLLCYNLFLIATIPSLFLTKDLIISFYTFIKFFLFGALFLIINKVSFTDEEYKIFIKTFLIGIIFVTVLSIVKYVLKIDLSEAGIEKYPGSWGRTNATFFLTTYYGLFINLVFAYVLHYYQKCINKKQFILLGIVLILLFTSLLLTFTRSSYIVFLGILAMLFVLDFKKMFTKRTVILLLILLSLNLCIPGAKNLLIVSIQDGIKIVTSKTLFILGEENYNPSSDVNIGKVNSKGVYGDYSMAHRELYATVAKKVYSTSKFTGIGLGTYEEYMHSKDFDTLFPNYEETQFKVVPHSSLILMLVEAGFFATIFFIASITIWIFNIIFLVFNSHKKDRNLYSIMVITLAIFIGMLLTSFLSENSFYDSQLFSIFIIIICLFTGYVNQKIIIKKRVMFISSTGGHLNELKGLKDIFNDYDYEIVTEKTKSTVSLIKEFPGKVNYLAYGTKDRRLFLYPFILLFNSFKSLYLYIILRPEFIVTTGTHTAGPMCCIGKIFGSKIIYIETFANIHTKTATGRIIYYFADLFIVQWEDMLKLYPKAKYGGWIY